MAEQLDPKELLMEEVSEQNKTDEIEHDKLPDNTITIVLKVDGKVYAKGGVIDIKPDMADEDLDSTLRAIHGLSQTAQRTLIDIAKKPAGYPTINTTVEDEETGGASYAYAVNDKGIVMSITGNLGAAAKAGIEVDKPVPES